MNDESKNDASLGGISPGSMSMLRRCEDKNSERSRTLSLFVYSVGKKVAKEDVRRRTTRVAHLNECQRYSIKQRTESLTPFGFDTEEDPDPASKNLKQFHHKDATFQVVKVV